MSEAEKLVNLLFPYDRFSPEAIPHVALAVLEFTPTLQCATEAETQHIFDSLCCALSDLQHARIVAKSARWIA